MVHFTTGDASAKDDLNAFFELVGGDQSESGIARVCEGENEELNAYGECVEIQTFQNIDDLLASFQ